jgi:PilZ domain
MSNMKDPLTVPSGRSTYPEIRRTQRVHIAIPILVRGMSGTQKFEEAGRTTTVNAHGCLISMTTRLSRGQQVSLIHPKTAEELPCKVVYISERAQDRADVGLEFMEPSPLFWRIAFPPEDWGSSSERKRTTGPVAGKLPTPGTAATPASNAPGTTATPPKK